MKAVVAAFNQEKALVGAFSVIAQLHRLIDLRHYTYTITVACAGGPWSLVLGPSLRDFAGNQKQRDVNMSAYIAYLPAHIG